MCVYLHFYKKMSWYCIKRILEATANKVGSRRWFIKYTKASSHPSGMMKRKALRRLTKMDSCKQQGLQKSGNKKQFLPSNSLPCIFPQFPVCL